MKLICCVCGQEAKTGTISNKDFVKGPPYKSFKCFQCALKEKEKKNGQG